jgi:AraC family transcriptional regulator
VKVVTPAECPGLNYLCLETRASITDILAPIELSASRPNLGKPLSPESGLILNLWPSDNAAPEAKLNGRALRVVPFPYGTLVLAGIVNLSAATASRSFQPCRVYLRRAAFDQLADSYGANRVSNLDLTARSSGPDTVLADLQACLWELLEAGGASPRPWTNHIIQAIHCYIAHTYGGMALPSGSTRGGLARWQLRLALEQLEKLPGRGRPPLAQIAQACGLSVSHFSRAFKRSTGASPLHWSKRRRVERAKELMRSTTRSLTDISEACGFADQSHFSNEFSLATETTPARWRQRHRAEAGGR